MGKSYLILANKECIHKSKHCSLCHLGNKRWKKQKQKEDKEEEQKEKYEK